MGPPRRPGGLRALLGACCAVPSVHSSYDGDNQDKAGQQQRQHAAHNPGQEQQQKAALGKQPHVKQDLKGTHSLRWHHTNRDPEDSPFELHGNGDSNDLPSSDGRGNTNTIGLPSPANSGGTNSGGPNSGGGASGSSGGLRHHGSGGSARHAGGGATGGLGHHSGGAVNGGKRQNSASTSGAACSDAGGESCAHEEEPRGMVRRVFSRGSDISLGSVSASSTAAAAAAAQAAGAGIEGSAAAALASSSAVFDIMLDAAAGGLADGSCSGSSILQPAHSAPLERHRSLSRSISLLAPRSKSILSVANLTPPTLPRPSSSSHVNGSSSGRQQQQQLPSLQRTSATGSSIRQQQQQGSSISGSNRASASGSSGESGRPGRVQRTESAFSINSSRSSSSTALLAAAAIRGNASSASICSSVEDGAAAAGAAGARTAAVPVVVGAGAAPGAAAGAGATTPADAPAITISPPTTPFNRPSQQQAQPARTPTPTEAATAFARAFLDALARGDAEWASAAPIESLLDPKARMVAVDGSVHDGRTAVTRRLNQGVAQLVKMLGDSADARAAASALASRPPALEVRCPSKERPGRLCATYTFRLGVRKFVLRDEVVVGRDGRIKRLRRLRS